MEATILNEMIWNEAKSKKCDKVSDSLIAKTIANNVRKIYGVKNVAVTVIENFPQKTKVRLGIVWSGRIQLENATARIRKAAITGVNKISGYENSAVILSLNLRGDSG